MCKTKKNSKTKKNRSCVNTLKDIIFTGGTNTFRLIRVLKNAVSEIEQLRKERDEARRMVCGLDADLMEDQRDYARHRGWDCFDITPNDIEPHEIRGDVAGPEGAD